MTPRNSTGSLILWLAPLLLLAAVSAHYLLRQVSHLVPLMVRDVHLREMESTVSASVLKRALRHPCSSPVERHVAEEHRGAIARRAHLWSICAPPGYALAVRGRGLTTPPPIDFEQELRSPTVCAAMREVVTRHSASGRLLSRGSVRSPAWCNPAEMPPGSIKVNYNLSAPSGLRIRAAHGASAATIVASGYLEIPTTLTLDHPTTIICGGDIYLGQVEGQGNALTVVSTTGRVVIDSWHDLASLAIFAREATLVPPADGIAHLPAPLPTLDRYPFALGISAPPPP